jgi:hypothetical protein
MDPDVTKLLQKKEKRDMMKKSRLTRLFSLFAALMMCVSLLSAVASASEIQPRAVSCPICGGTLQFDYGEVETNKRVGTCVGGIHYEVELHRYGHCFDCGKYYATDDVVDTWWKCSCENVNCSCGCPQGKK